jgi:hypothetical protein
MLNNANVTKTLSLRVDDLEEATYRLNVRLARCQRALTTIAMPVRPDGTFNNDRESCRQIAQSALDNLEFI